MLLANRKQCLLPRSKSVFSALITESQRDVDRIFAKIFVGQWVFGILCACLISPRVWAGSASSVHTHVWAAILLSGVIFSVPLLLIRYAPGRMVTRLAVSSGQTLYSVLLIHLMGGRIEAHFHIFVSLALLAAYRDRTVFVPAVLITIVDHVVRGYLWPQSVFGANAVATWRPLEHGAWVFFEALSLCYLIGQNLSQLATIASLQCTLQDQRDALECRVNDRTVDLRNAKEFQESILNSLDAEICVLGPSGDIVFVNNRWKAFGQDGGSIISTLGPGANYLETCDRVVGQEASYAKHVARMIREVRDGITRSFMGEYPCHFGDRKRWFHIRVNPVQFSGVRGVAIVHIDVTKTKKAHSRAESFAKLVLNSPNEIFIVSKETMRFIEVNQGGCNNLGYDRETLLTMSPVDLHPDLSTETFRELLNGLLTGQVDTLFLESTHQRKDGSVYQCSVDLHNSLLEDEEVIVAFVTDITHRKQLEQQLAQAQKLESVGQLAAGVAHEINTPMQCVFGNVEFLNNSFEKLLTLSDYVVALLDKCDCDWSEERRTLEGLREEYNYNFLRQQTPLALQEAAEASTKVISIVRAMRVLTHPGSTKKVSTDLHDMIRSASTITRNRWKSVAEVEFDFDPKIHEIEVLPAELSQVFINMFVNSTDALSEKLGQDPNELGKIKIKTLVHKDDVEIRFSDTGGGMTESVRTRVFDPFFTTKDVGKGTGQGLAISHNVIVNLHSGQIDVQSILGVGTTFTIRIPRFPASDSELSEKRPTPNSVFANIDPNSVAQHVF